MNFSGQSEMQRKNHATTLATFYSCSIKIFLYNRPMVAKYFTKLCKSIQREFSIFVENTVVWYVRAIELRVHCSSLAPSCVSA